MVDEDTVMSEGGFSEPSTSKAVLAWDRQKCVPLDLCLSKDDMVLLLTPLVVPDGKQTAPGSDPFEPLGKALAQRHPVVRHVPYTKAGGITGVHVAFIKKADVVVFLVSGLSSSDETSQLDLAEAVGEACDARPLIVLLCGAVEDDDLQAYDFSTIIRSSGFGSESLASVASLLLDGSKTTQSLTPPIPQPSPRRTWNIERSNDRKHLEELYSLWEENVPRQYHLDRPAFAELFVRDGYSLHHIVRDPPNSDIIGWCATYTTFADGRGEQLVGSIASIVVKKAFRGRGIGCALHEDASSKLTKIRGVRRVQLGTTFPRLFYGPPPGHMSEKWLHNRGWELDQASPGKGRLMVDWLLWFSESSSMNLASAGLSFRPCELADVEKVLQFVDRESERKHGFGWHDQYAAMFERNFVGEIILGFEGATMVASAITYMPNCGNPTACDLPWAATIGGDVGGITCISIKDDDPEMVSRRDTIMVRLLYSCCKYLHSRNMAGAFLDALKSDEAGVETLGFRHWAQYREVWRHV